MKRSRSAGVSPWWFQLLSWQLQARWKQGHLEYGDRSFAQPASELRFEVLQELVDVVGWLFVLWRSRQVQRGLAKDRRRSERRFLAAVRRHVLIGDLAQRSIAKITSEADVLCEIERLAALASLQWNEVEKRLALICGAVAALQQPTETHITDEAHRGQRGGVRE